MTPTATLEAAREALAAAQATEATRAAEHAAARDAATIASTGAELEAARRARVDAEHALATAEEAVAADELATKRKRLEGAVRDANRKRFFRSMGRTIERLADMLAWRFEDSEDHTRALPRLVPVSPFPDPYLPAREHRRALAIFARDEPERAALLRAVRKAVGVQNEACTEACSLRSELGATTPELRPVTEHDVLALVVLDQAGDTVMPRNWWFAWEILAHRRLSSHEEWLMSQRGVPKNTSFARALVVHGDLGDALDELAPLPTREPYVSSRDSDELTRNRERLGWNTFDALR